jgi:glycosyltransferase involved in cell wall biosynthesis
MNDPSRIRLLWVKNIPSPYRNHRFETMLRVFPKYGIDFEVHFMAWHEPDRFWRFQPEDIHYPSRFHAGVQLRPIKWFGSGFHFNPGLLRAVRREHYDILVVGGYASPSAALTPFLARPGTVMLVENESNLSSSKWTRGIVGRVKAAILRRYHAYIIPGPRSRELTEFLLPEAAQRPFLTFPNLIDKGVFVNGVAETRKRRDEIRRELGVDNSTSLWVCPARLETFKGLHLFLPLLEGIKGVRMLVAGEGSLRQSFQDMIDEKNLPVRLLGQQGESQMVRLYAAADLFVLPSLSDPSPLSVIEACASRLPLLASRRVGNFADVVEEGVNGWGYDADDPPSNAELVRRIAGTSRDRLAEMGEASAERYARIFDSDACCERLAQGIRQVWEGCRPGGPMR